MTAASATSAELMLQCCADIVRELIAAHDEQRSVNLNALKTRVSAKYKMAGTPRLVDIIAAIPDHYRDRLVPSIRARPVRTASVEFLNKTLLFL